MSQVVITFTKRRFSFLIPGVNATANHQTTVSIVGAGPHTAREESQVMFSIAIPPTI